MHAQLPSTWAREELITTASASTIALGFPLAWSALRTIQVVSVLQQAWVREGSRAKCVVELDGVRPIVATIATAKGWTDLEREIVAVFRARMVEPVPEAAAAPVIDDPVASWIDERGRCVALDGDGAIAELPSRTLASAREDQRTASVVQHADGRWALATRDQAMTLPADPASERTVLECSTRRIVVAERRGTSVRFATCSALGAHTSEAIANADDGGHRGDPRGALGRAPRRAARRRRLGARVREARRVPHRRRREIRSRRSAIASGSPASSRRARGSPRPSSGPTVRA